MAGFGSSPVCLGWGLAVPSLDPTLWLPVRPAAGCSDVPAVKSGCPQSPSGSRGVSEHLSYEGSGPAAILEPGAGMYPLHMLEQECTSREPQFHCGRAARGRIRDFVGEVEPGDTWTRATGGACGVPRERHPLVGSGSSGTDLGSRPARLRSAPAGQRLSLSARAGRDVQRLRSHRRARSSAQRIRCADVPPQDRPLHPNPAPPALLGAASPRLPRCPTPAPGPLSPAALYLRLSRCPASPRLPSGTPNPRAAPEGEPRAVPSQSPPFPWGCHSRRLPQPRENLPHLPPSHGTRPLLGSGPGRRCRTTSGRAGSSRRESAQVPGAA